jgi:nicotinamide-nucleotide amidase
MRHLFVAEDHSCAQRPDTIDQRGPAVAEAPRPATERLAEALLGRSLTLAVAESLTGGSISAQLACAPDSGRWFRGGVVAYASEVKHELLGVPAGPVVSEAAARAMAEGVRDRLGADIAVSVTGVGGPDPQDGQPPGTVWMGISDGSTTRTRRLHLDGEPGEVVDRTRDTAIEWLLELCEAEGDLPA